MFKNMAELLIAWNMESDIFPMLLANNSNVSSLLSSCYRLMLVSSQNSYVEILTSNDGIRRWALWEEIGS